MATDRGALFRLSNDHLALAPWNPAAKNPSPKPLPDDIAALVPSREREPSVAGKHAYFISEGELVRVGLDDKRGMEVLATDAVRGTRAVAVTVGTKEAAAYIAAPLQEGGDRRARLWLEGEGSLDLSPEGSGATSVSLLAWGGRKLLAASLEGRTSMSPVHGRFLDLGSGAPHLGPDVVLSVGPGAEPYSEITLARAGNTSFALVPLAKSPREFGLMALPIGQELRMEITPSWVVYPNGLDPAPVATTTACGKSFIAFIRPEAPQPGAPAVIELASLGDDGIAQPGTLLASARFVRSVSLASRKDAILVVWVADGQSFARTLRC